MATGQFNLNETSDLGTIFHGIQNNRNRFACSEGFLAPAPVGHVGRIGNLGSPMNDIAGGILHIELEETVRVDPEPFA